MKKIILSLSFLAFIGVLVAGATQAVWSDSKTIQGNTVSTANVELSLVKGKNTQTVQKPVVSENLVPGDWGEWHHIGVKNVGTVEGTVHMRVVNVQGIVKEICDNTWLQIEVHGDSVGSSGEKWPVYNGPLKDLEDGIELTGVGVFDPSLPVNWVLVVHQKAGLHPDAPNWTQNRECTWDEIFIIESYAGDGDGFGDGPIGVPI